MEKLKGQIEVIIDELKRIQDFTVSEIAKQEPPYIPLTIEGAHGNVHIITPKIDRAISSISDITLEGNHAIGQKYTRSDWKYVIRRYIGEAFSEFKIGDNDDQNLEQFFDCIQNAIDNDDNLLRTREYTFVCSLFDCKAIEPFCFGPVLFEHRDDWLARKYKESKVTIVTKRRINNFWTGKILRKRKTSAEAFLEEIITDAIGSYQFVCTVKTDRLGSEAGREKALTAARLAITGISLLFPQFPSKTLKGVYLPYDRQPQKQVALSFSSNVPPSTQQRWSLLPCGPKIQPNQWSQALTEYKDIIEVIGELLAYVLDSKGSFARPQLMSTFLHSLLWFHEGCYENINTIAVVKFSSALDALSGGKKAKGIRQIFHARLGLAPEKKITSDGKTLRQWINEIYGEGRSRTVHGTNDKLSQDWARTRNVAEHLAWSCLLACLEWAARNPTANDPALMRKL